MVHFVVCSTACTKADLIKINRHTVTSYFHTFRESIVLKIEDEIIVKREIDVDESYFRGKRVRGAAGSVPVLVCSSVFEKFIQKL